MSSAQSCTICCTDSYLGSANGPCQYNGIHWVQLYVYLLANPCHLCQSATFHVLRCAEHAARARNCCLPSMSVGQRHRSAVLLTRELHRWLSTRILRPASKQRSLQLASTAFDRRGHHINQAAAASGLNFSGNCIATEMLYWPVTPAARGSERETSH